MDDVTEFIKAKEGILADTTDGRIFKTIRCDAFDFWNDVANSLVNPAQNRVELRKGPRDSFAARLKKDQSGYEVVVTDKTKRSSLHGIEKIQYSKHQSVSYTNYAVGFSPPFFGHDRLRLDLIVGISFHPKDIILQRLMRYDGGTLDRTSYSFRHQEAG